MQKVVTSKLAIPIHQPLESTRGMIMQEYYQTEIRLAALNFICRHHHEYHNQKTLLFQSTVLHLRNQLQISPLEADQVTHQAYQEWLGKPHRPYLLDINYSNAFVAMIIDYTGSSYAIPTSSIATSIIEPNRK
ncbi:MAG: hypothetical protein CENE_03463 [Candidatus Celerinatantimonas neptuna]|nr:MAG: hypothetical protein CENE_03463 [Candidatus Celerinatantimonas neptuna]